MSSRFRCPMVLTYAVSAAMPEPLREFCEHRRVSDALSVSILLLLLGGSGWGDALGFIHAAKVWNDGSFSWAEVGRSAGWFAFGIAQYWLALYWARRLGIVSPGVQTLLWFTVTIVGVAVGTGDVGRWRLADQLLAAAIVVGMAVFAVRQAA